MRPEELVDQSELLVQAMGRWPSFHDANVLNIVRSDDSFLATIHVFDMTSEVDAAGYFVLRRHHLVTLAMTGVRASSLPEIYPGDVLLALTFSGKEAQVRVDFESHMGLDGSVLCDRVKVIKVEACDHRGHPG